MAKRINSTPKADNFRMPGEYEPQEKIWMLWPERPDNWRDGGKPAQKAFVRIAEAISRFAPVTMGVNRGQFANARNMLPAEVRVVEMSNDDSWIRDCGPSFVVNDKGEVRGVDWDFNAWGGLVDGLYFPWDQDELVARKVCEIENVDSYKTSGFVLEGGAFHVDGEGTLITTEMCLLSEGRNPHLTKSEIEQYLKDYLNLETIIWLPDGIDPDETNGHVDDVACFARPGEVVCIWTEDTAHPYYEAAQKAYKALSEAVDAKGRKLKVHKFAVPKKMVCIKGADGIDYVEGTIPREEGEMAIASYLNFLIVNGGIILPQFGDENDELAMEQAKAIFPDYEVVGVRSEEVAYGGGNIHCITQQQPKG
ncbi:MAG TPA: agmatine deiminase [Clostridiaceae bacterium]|nr:agmatine deiminase [Clostridiaceae bacterium]